MPALAALLWFLGQALYDFARTLRRLSTASDGEAPDTAGILHGAIAVILAMMLGGYFEVNLGDSEVLAMFLGALGCGYSALSID